MVAVHHMEARSDQNDLQNKTRLRPVSQCISKHDAWLTKELEKDFNSFQHAVVSSSIRANRGPIEYS
jgi:hypothetical protein